MAHRRCGRHRTSSAIVCELAQPSACSPLSTQHSRISSTTHKWNIKRRRHEVVASTGVATCTVVIIMWGVAYHYHLCCCYMCAAGQGVRSLRVFSATERAAAGAGNRRKTDFLCFRRVYSFQACRVFTTRRNVSSRGTTATVA